MTTATKPRDLLTALRVGLYHTTLAAERAHGLARLHDQDGKHGTGAEFRRSAAESEAAAEMLRAAVAAAPDLLAALRLMVAAHEPEAGFYLHPDGRPKLTATGKPSPKGSALVAARAAISQVQQGQQTEEQA